MERGLSAAVRKEYELAFGYTRMCGHVHLHVFAYVYLCMFSRELRRPLMHVFLIARPVRELEEEAPGQRLS